MFVDIRIAFLSRAVALVVVLDIQLRLILASPTGSGGFTLLDPKVLLLGVTCYLVLGSQRGLLPTQEEKDKHSA